MLYFLLVMNSIFFEKYGFVLFLVTYHILSIEFSKMGYNENQCHIQMIKDALWGKNKKT